jgi:hypothetical protein
MLEPAGVYHPDRASVDSEARVKSGRDFDSSRPSFWYLTIILFFEFDAWCLLEIFCLVILAYFFKSDIDKKNFFLLYGCLTNYCGLWSLGYCVSNLSS